MPPLESDLAAGAAGNNSSDFVRKLYKMLEDPAYSSVVRWGNEGDSFVVLENERFTKTILPKHFKHSNFASFVRQLNKYDFHKVRQNEENGQSPYGPNAWEFKHPGFRADNKDNLDNIRRKAPASRKAASVEEFPANQQVTLLNDTLAATQHQVQALQEHFYQLTQTNKILVDEILSLQKMVKAHSQVNNELIAHLSNVDERRRSSRHSAQSNHSGHSGSVNYSANMGMLPDGADEPAPELRRAREILNEISPNPVADREFHRLSVAYQEGSPPESAASSSILYPQPSSAPMPMMPDTMNEMRHLVYPVGQTTGIDPFHADHIHNIPYSRPLSTPTAVADVPPQATPPPTKELSTSLWGMKKPHILLVEDDKTCARIGGKFLSQSDATVEIARDGQEALNKVNNDPDRFDLIFMDIIMPVFDGVSATACIRMVQPRVPIIAMTSNIRQEDIAMYFHWGMNDVLAKPFTKDGMVRILRKHLNYLLKHPLSPEELAQNGTTGPQGTYAVAGAMAAPPSLSSGGKFDTTPIQSPATSSSWHSPSQMQQPSPNLDSSGGYMSVPAGSGSGGPVGPVVLTPGGTQRPQYHNMPQVGTPPIPRMPDGMQDGERPEKRQRLYPSAPPPGQYH